ncbi:MAG: M1 family aminopeptidase [Bacteroidia bacterium]
MISKSRFLIVAAVLSSCNLTHKTQKTDKPLVFNMDTTSVSPASEEPQVYQASVTRLSDIIHTKLEVSFDWSKQYMYGKAWIKAKPYFYPQSTLVLDAKGMQINEISLVSKALLSPEKPKEFAPVTTEVRTKLPYKYENDLITIQLDKEYTRSQEYEIFIDYVAKPEELKKGGGSAAITDDKGLYFINPLGTDKTKPMEIWTQGETQSTSVWMPTIDHPNEKMTQEIYMTVDKKYVTLSNGELCSSFDNGDGTRTDYWRMDLPHSTYLAMMAVGDFAVVKDKWRGKEVSYYVEHEYEPYARNIFGNTPEMMEFFSNKLGVDYVWNKYSQIVARDYVSGAMENTTATLHSEYLQRTDRELLDKDYEDYVSHELFHQWFGDLVTCESWSNLPLNESFATYGEYLWQEFKYGRDAADNHSAESRAGYFAEAERKQVPLIRYHYEDKEDMFDGHSYNKGGQVLHMLRCYVGDDAFFASLKLYLETNKFSNAEITDLRLAFEKVTGEDLNWFFDEWFLSAGHPDLVIKTDYDAAKKKAVVEIRQVQDFSKTRLFRIPLDVDVYVAGKATRTRIIVTKASETFEFDADAKPDLINVDAQKMLLCTKSENKTISELAYQYKHAPLYLDRAEAVHKLAEKTKDSLAAQTIIAALSDKFWSIRLDALDALKDIPAGYDSQILEIVKRLAEKDEKSSVQSVAIDYLSVHYKNPELEAIYKNGMSSRSYYVISSSINAIAKVNPEEGMKYAKQNENEKNVDLLYAVAEVYGDYGSDDNNAFFVNAKDKFTGFAVIGYVNLYGVFLKKVKRDETVNSGVDLLAGIAKQEGVNKYVAYYAKRSIKDLVTMYDDRIAANSGKIKDAKSANSNAPVAELETQIERDKAQRERIANVLNSLK